MRRDAKNLNTLLIQLVRIQNYTRFVRLMRSRALETFEIDLCERTDEIFG